MVAGGFRTFVAGETLDEDKINDFLMQGVLVFADEAARDAAITDPVHGQVAFLQDSNATLFYDGADWVALGVGTFTAADVTGTTGSPGTATAGGFTYYTFTGTGSITFGRDGLADLLMIGAGAAGGGGAGPGLSAGGGGAADIRQLNNVFFEAGVVTVTVPGGGAASGSSRGANGFSSAIGVGSLDKTHILTMGGGGGAGSIAQQRSGQSGASGGGEYATGGVAGVGLTQFDGGTGSGVSGGGGGGAGAVGGNAVGNTGGDGGAGTNAYATWATATSTGVSDHYAGGGGGGGNTVGGGAGSGGGGAGATGAANAGNGTANTGSGGGGSENAGTTGGNGGSGLVIVRVLA